MFSPLVDKQCLHASLQTRARWLFEAFGQVRTETTYWMFVFLMWKCKSSQHVYLEIPYLSNHYIVIKKSISNLRIFK